MKAPEHTSAFRLVQARGTLQLIHPNPGESVLFDADEYTRIDFRLIWSTRSRSRRRMARYST